MAAATSSDSAAAPAAALIAEYAQLQTALSDPAVHTDQSVARRLGRRYAELTPIVTTANSLEAASGDLGAAVELAAEDPTFADEVTSLTELVDELQGKLAALLTPRDPDGAKDAQLQNKEQAMRILRARMLAAARDAAAATAADARRSQVRTVDRSERVRTYNYPENRIADHRVGFKAYNLDAVLDGDLDAVLDSLDQADRSERLGGGGPGGA